MQRYVEENTSSTTWEMSNDNLVPSTFTWTNDYTPMPSTPDCSQVPPFTTAYDAAFGSATVMDCEQQRAQYTRFCPKCHAVLLLGETLSTHMHRYACKMSYLFQQKNDYKLWFECYSCSESPIRCQLKYIGIHMAMVHHDVRHNWDKQFMSYFCMVCKTMLYSPWSVLNQHRLTCSSGVMRPKLDKRLPAMTIIMRWLMKDYLDNGRETLKYACLCCKHYKTVNRNPFINCSVCLCKDNKFYCKSCNVVFSCPKSGYDTHLHTFEHSYIVFNKIIEPSTVPGLNRRDGRARSKGGRDGGRGGGRPQIASNFK